MWLNHDAMGSAPYSITSLLIAKAALWGIPATLRPEGRCSVVVWLLPSASLRAACRVDQGNAPRTWILSPPFLTAARVLPSACLKSDTRSQRGCTEEAVRNRVASRIERVSGNVVCSLASKEPTACKVYRHCAGQCLWHVHGHPTKVTVISRLRPVSAAGRSSKHDTASLACEQIQASQAARALPRSRRIHTHLR